MSGCNQYEAARQAKALLIHSMPGKKTSIRTHIKRAERVAMIIWCRWQVTPATWKVKHIRWYLNHSTRNLATTTRNDHWRTVEALISRQGKLSGWLPHLIGTWLRRDGLNKPIANTGRPKKLPHAVTLKSRV